ncbi:thioredoxin domain-containing protein 9-like [Stylophora pistillata]|uniref:thioredoxin domain-containing protein 9-like n=1 Tax=Stylophora pistillata TaxID=50429 RepID=UPI000C0491C0|nr:thioredoxin domain-containing protein 9-like [Stylophora pistillata]
MAGNIEHHIQNTLLQATKVMEEQIDSEIEKLDRMTLDEMEELREKRLEQLKKQEEQKREWLHKGHGQYNEIPGEKEFFKETKDSPRIVCHFFRDSTFRCKIVDKHLALLAPKHIETKFIKVDAERCHFLVQKLNVKVLPTILIIKDGKFPDRIVGFDDLGGHDEFSTAMMEWRIARSGVINYTGDLSVPPDQANKKSSTTILKKSIRSRRDMDDDEDSEDDD